LREFRDGAIMKARWGPAEDGTMHDTPLDVPFDLIRYFTGSALVVVLVATIAFAGTSTWLVERSFLEIEEEEANAIAEDLVSDLTVLGYDRDRWGSGAVPAAFGEHARQQMEDFGITDFSLYSSAGRRLEGFAPEGAPDRPLWLAGFERATKGETALRWESDRGGPIPWIRGSAGGGVESYAPVRDHGRVVAVARVRRNRSPNLGKAEGSLPLLIGIALASGIAVFGALWLLVFKADRILKRQHEDLVSVQDDLARQNLQLATLNRRKDEFYAMCSHDLRSPLVSVEAGCRLLLDGDTTQETRREIAAENLRNAGVVLDLVNNLLDLARLEEHAESLDATDLDLATLVDGIVAANRPFATSRGVPLEVEAPRGGVVVLGDRLKLVRILNNLVSNAIKHADGKPVTVALTRHATSVRLLVRDRGPGLHPDVRAALLSGSTPAPAQGGIPDGEVHGFGLFIVRRLVDMHGGSLDVRSDAGAGTTFVVTLPAA
jgi:signal transduction histidine kinase